jgi:hypothetical protein
MCSTSYIGILDIYRIGERIGREVKLLLERLLLCGVEFFRSALWT